jgi:hypothetical protein
MGIKKSLPTQIKEVLRYHAKRNDFARDNEYIALMNDLTLLDEKVADVKAQIMDNRKARMQAAAYAKQLTATHSE